MEWASVAEDRLIVWTDKRDRRVELPMPPELVPVFAGLQRTGPNVLPFVYESHRDVRAWYCLKKKADLPRELVRHCLRHTYATELLKSGLPVEQIQKRLGHFSVQMTQKYLHMDGEGKEFDWTRQTSC